MFCPKCGTKNKEGANFCKKCGQPLEVKGQKVPRAKTIFRYVFLLLVILVGAVGIFVIFSNRAKLAEIFLFKKQDQSEWISWNVPEGSTDQETEQLIHEGVLENNFITPPSNKKKEEYLWRYSIESLQVEGDWAVLSAAPKDKSNDVLVDTEGIPLLGRKINDHWEIAHPQEVTFILWLPQIPDSLLALETKAYLIMRYGGDE